MFLSFASSDNTHHQTHTTPGNNYVCGSDLCSSDITFLRRRFGAVRCGAVIIRCIVQERLYTHTTRDIDGRSFARACPNQSTSQPVMGLGVEDAAQNQNQAVVLQSDLTHLAMQQLELRANYHWVGMKRSPRDAGRHPNKKEE